MAGYPKIWTTLLSEPWFAPLSLNAKGVYLLLLLEAKKQGDSGDVVFTGWSSLAQYLGGDRSTVANIVRKFQQIGKVIVVEKSARLLHLKIANYRKYQDVKNYRPNIGDDQALRENPQQPDRSEPNNLITEAEEPGQPPEPPTEDDSPILFAGSYKLSELTKIPQSKFEKLKEAYPKLDLNSLLKEADLYWMGKAGKRKDHYRAFLNWIKKHNEINQEKNHGGRKTSRAGSPEEFDEYVKQHGNDKWPDR
jgi:hypothetical protein